MKRRLQMQKQRDPSFARVIRAIGSRDDIDHVTLVAFRRHVMALHRQDTEQTPPSLLAFALLSYLENGTQPDTALAIPLDALRARAERAAGVLRG